MSREKRGKGQPKPAAHAVRVAEDGRRGQFLVAAIGASAGGIEAFIELIRHLLPNTGMAFVLIQHLDPKHHSILTDLVAKETAMTVEEVTDGKVVEPNHVYVIPPNTMMDISGRVLHLSPRDESRAQYMPIDRFMRSLAEDQGNKSVGVILSGSGSDGTKGLAEIQAHGGVIFVQDETTAKYDGMPRSAIAAGGVDYVLPPRGIARELARIAQHPYVVRIHGTEEAGSVPRGHSGLNNVFGLLRKSTGVDFTHYRHTTILRRIERRMVVHKFDKLEDYVKYVQVNPAEIQALYQDMLINVTSFFRNPRLFDALKSKVFPQLLKNRAPEIPIRVWTPGCASGEEPYSLAIALLEYLGDKALRTPIQIFGTDVSESSISKARIGFYPENIQGDVSTPRLRRFFQKLEGGFRISKSIRDMCIFAQHNLLNDPPFSQMDVICCRNLLIYLEPMLQNKVISLFHYALRPSTFLVLGSSEGIGTLNQLFGVEDRAHKVFLRKNTGSRQMVTFSLGRPGEHVEFGAPRIPVRQSEAAWNYSEAQKEFDRRLLTQYTPATVFINQDMEIIHTRGNVSRYLKLAPGRASLSVLKMAREGLLFDLRNAVNRARKENATVRRHGIEMKNGNGTGDGKATGATIRQVNLEVVPLSMTNLKELYFMIIFEDVKPGKEQKSEKKHGARAGHESKSSARRIAKLEQELASTQEYLHSVIENQEASNEELQSANEEILSSNEELQSTNEELETAKEELQSANEELTTVNDELRTRNVEVTQANNDLTNLLSSINIAMIMLGSDLSIRRFTPQAQKLLGLIPSDVGRPFLNINPAIDIPDFQQLVLQVMTNFSTIEREVSDRLGNRYLLRILPYRTLDNKIDGGVITLMDMVRFPREFMLVLDANLRVRTASPVFYNNFQLTVEDVENRSLMQLAGGSWNSPLLIQAIEQSIRTGRTTEDLTFEQESPGLGRRRIRAYIGSMKIEGGNRLAFLCGVDVTSDWENTFRVQRAILDIVHDAVIVRDMTGRIQFWSRGAETLYQWTSAEAMGKLSHDLLNTKFPIPLQDVESKALEHNLWEGELVHFTREGEAINVASRWGVLREAGRPIAILEVDREIQSSSVARKARSARTR
jgi:two-component system CheB/CheR fusion protein